MSTRQPEMGFSAVNVDETFNLATQEVKPYPEANISSLTYFACGEGWRNFIVLEVVDIVTDRSVPPPTLVLGGNLLSR